MGRSFRILGTLGKGAFGEVHLTEIRTDDDFVQTLAVKWLHAEYSDDVELASRLRDEARLLGLLDHPHIVRVQGLTRLDGRLAILMEAVHGCDLSGLHLPPKAAAQVCAAVAEALDAAWTSVPPGREDALRVVHRDIKPSNVMVTRRGDVKVMDFGVARATFESREAQTRSQQYGTARYMAPERWLEGVAEGPSDVFSLGVTLVELVSGAPMPRARLSRQGFEEDVEAAVATIEPQLRALTRRLLAFEPAARPTSVEVSEALKALDLPGADLRSWAPTLETREAVPTDRTGTIVVEDTNATIALTQPLTATTSLEDVSPRRWPWLLLAALLLIVPGITYLSRSPTAQPPVAPSTQPRPSPPTPEPVVPPDPEPTIQPDPEPPSVASPPEPPPPAAEPVALRPTTPRPVAPEPEPEPPPLDPPPTVPVTFMLDPGLSLTSDHGRVQPPRGALMLPADSVVRLTVQGPDGSYHCTISIHSAPATWHVGDGQCRERQ